MNASVVRLVVIDSRAAWGRLLGITAGVAVGVTLALLLGGAYQGLSAPRRTVQLDERLRGVRGRRRNWPGRGDP